MLYRLTTLLSLLLLPVLAWAGESAAGDYLFQPQFMFKHQTITSGNPYASEAFWRNETITRQNLLIDKDNPLVGRVEQYDATIFYPFSKRDDLNIDMGINIRFIDAAFEGQLEQGNHYIYTALPMFYANALIKLPFEGLQASVGATHTEYEQYYALDYKAKLSYTWSNGLGLTGGWQHQQFSIDSNDIQAQFENKGPFLDFNYRF